MNTRVAVPQVQAQAAQVTTTAPELQPRVRTGQEASRTSGASRPEAASGSGWSQDLSGVPLVQRKCAGGGSAGVSSSFKPEGECEECAKEHAKQLQPKLHTSMPGDSLELEADRVADAVVSGGAVPSIGAVGAAGGGIGMPAQRSAAPGACQGSSAATRGVEGVMRSSGQPLDAPVRQFMESRFRHDFSSVRIHAGAQAAESAARIGARAYTVGHNVAFGSGEFSPETPSGRRLLAHELTHVVQQQRLPGTSLPIMRTACEQGAWDGRQPGCGAGTLARWRLVDIATQEVTNIALDQIIVKQGLARHFPGNWAAQVQTPPNPVKSGAERGYADGMKVQTGGTLRVEVVEVKSRSTQLAGGCALAGREAAGYVRVLRPLGPQIIAISQALAQVGGLRTEPGRINATQQFVLEGAGVYLANPATRDAWKFYNSLQNRLNVTFSAPFTAFEADVHTEGTRNQIYPAGPAVIVECTVRRGRKPGVKRRQLGFQVNKIGGVSYGCQDTPCVTQEEDEERQRQQQPVAQPQADAQPQAQPQADPAPTAQDQQTPEGDDLTVPVLVGAGGAALTAGAIAAARARARRIAGERAARLAAEQLAKRTAERAAQRAAARNVINLAERRAAREAAKAGAGRVAGKAVGKAVIYAEVAAAIFLLASGRAEARVGSGPSALEALYKSMSDNGTPPSPEMRKLIESDPVLQQLAERAGATGDMTPLQEEMSRRVMELVRDNPGEFSAEDLELLAQMSKGTGSGVAPKTAEELHAAIERARNGGAAGTNQGGGGGGGTPPPPATGSGSGSGSSSTKSLDQAVEEVSKQHPSLSAESKGKVAAAPPEVRRVFDAMTSGTSGGPAVTDEFVARFHQIVPLDLSTGDADALIAKVGSAKGKTVEEVLAALQTAVQNRGKKPGDPHPPGAPDTPDGGTPAPDGGVPQPGQVPPPPGTTPDQPAPGQTPGPTTDEEREDARDAAEQAAERDRIIAMLRAAIDKFKGWDDIPVGSQLTTGDLTGKPAGSTVGAYVYIKAAAPNGNVVRAVAYVQLRVVKAAAKSGQTWRGTVVSSTMLVGDNGRTAGGFQAGQPISGVLR
jgi:hypothetical protein